MMDINSSEIVNNKAKKQTLKNCLENTGGRVKNDISNKKQNPNVGLQKPGSNWEKYRNIINTEITPTNQSSFNVQHKKKRSNAKPHKEPDKDIPQCIDKYQTSKSLKKENNIETDIETGLTRLIAMDCEMVGIGNDKESMIARVSIVNKYGVCVYDKYVKPTETVKNYRTAVSGIRPHHLKNGEDFNIVQKEVADILKGRILVGHALYNDLGVLFLSHPKRFQRDTSRYFRKFTAGGTPSLKRLAAEFLGIDIQHGEHNSIEDAQTTMQLYKLFKKQWESDIIRKL